MNKRPFEGVLLVCDMDGTLLNTNNDVTEENRAAIERFVNGGGYFTIATGRTTNGISRYFNELPVNKPIIVMNGAQVYDLKSNKVLSRHYLEDDVELVLRDLKDKFPELGIELFANDSIYIISGNDVTEWHKHKEKILPGIYKLEQVEKPWYKVVLAWDNSKLKEVDRYLKGKTGTSRAVLCEDVFLDLLNVNTSKGRALQDLIEMEGNSIKKVVAIGDNFNDIEMIKTADIGIAVENASDDIKKVAQFCTCHHNSHAAAYAIEWLEANI